MKTLMLLGFSTLLFSSVGLAADSVPGSACQGFWKEIRDLNDQYEEKHSEAAGKKLFAKLPKGKAQPPKDCTLYGQTLSALDRDQKYRAAQLKAGNPLAMKLSFRLMNVADGAFHEGLHIDLGNTIVKHPRHFLQLLKDEHGDDYCPDGLVGNTGEYDDDEKREKKIMGDRIKALMGVHGKSLQKIRDVCVARLKHLQGT